MKKIVDKIKGYAEALFGAMQATETEVLKSGGAAPEGTSISQNVHAQKLSHGLLKGEVNQQVEELRYRTYKVAEESEKYRYVTGTLVVKKERIPSHKLNIDNTTDLPVVIIADNFEIGRGVNESISMLTVDENGSYTGLDRGKKYNLEIERDFFPRHKIEEYVTRIIVKEIDEKSDEYHIELYVSVYPNPLAYKSKGFVQEIKRIKDEGIKSDVLDFKSLIFTTYKSYGEQDFITYKFGNIKFLNEITVFDGSYVIKFKGKLLERCKPFSEQYYSPEMAQKYENQEAKEAVANLSIVDKKEYVCEECGKVITNDEFCMRKPQEKDIQETEDENGLVHHEGGAATEFYDVEIIKATCGRTLCPDCFKRLLANGKIKIEQSHNINCQNQ